jgi:hypothetical protein
VEEQLDECFKVKVEEWGLVDEMVGWHESVAKLGEVVNSEHHEDLEERVKHALFHDPVIEWNRKRKHRISIKARMLCGC